MFAHHEFKADQPNRIRQCVVLSNSEVATISFFSNKVNFWNPQNGQLLGSIDAKAEVYCLALLPGNQIALGHNLAVTIWDLRNKTLTRTLVATDVVASLVHIQGALLASSPGSLQRWTLPSGGYTCTDREERLQGQALGCHMLQQSVLIDAYAGNSCIERWQVPAHPLGNDAFDLPSPARAVGVFANGYFLVGFDRSIQLLQFTAEAIALCLVYPIPSPCRSLVVTDDDQHFVSTHANGECLIWHRSTPFPLLSTLKLCNGVCNIVLGPQGVLGFFNQEGQVGVFEYGTIPNLIRQTNASIKQVGDEIKQVLPFPGELLDIAIRFDDPIHRLCFNLFRPVVDSKEINAEVIAMTLRRKV